jgi:hypothetical protein
VASQRPARRAWPANPDRLARSSAQRPGRGRLGPWRGCLCLARPRSRPAWHTVLGARPAHPRRARSSGRRPWHSSQRGGPRACPARWPAWPACSASARCGGSRPASAAKLPARCRVLPCAPVLRAQASGPRLPSPLWCAPSGPWPASSRRGRPKCHPRRAPPVVLVLMCEVENEKKNNRPVRG